MGQIRAWTRSPLGTLSLGVAVVVAWSLLYSPAETTADSLSSSAGIASTASSIGGPVALSVTHAGTSGRAPVVLQPTAPGVFGVNIAVEDADGTSLRAFHDALGRAARGEGQARLLFFGASHVASDAFTSVVRRGLQGRYGDAGHGFIVPVHPWRTYRHRDISIESDGMKWKTQRIRVSDKEIKRVGLAGVAMDTTRAGRYGRVTTTTRGPVGQSASQFELFFMRQPRGGALDVSIDGELARRISTRGKKIGAGYAMFRVPDGPHTFEIRTVNRRPVRLFGVTVERDEPGVIVDTLGINGSRARYQLLWEESIFAEHLIRRRPDLVVLAYGTNESGDQAPIGHYEANLRKVLKRVRKAAPDASCLLIGPSDRPVEVQDYVFEDRQRTADVIAVQHKVALDSGCGFFDLVAFQGGPLSTIRWAAHDPPYLQQDHIHYTKAGYQRLGEVVLQALLHGVD